MAKRKQDAAQQTIARSSDSFQQALQTLLQLSSEWYWEQDENYRFTAFTGAEIERTGIDTEGYLGTTRWDKGAVPLGDDNSWDQHRAVLESRQPFRDFVYSRIDATGELRRISASGDPVFAADGAFLGYRGVAKDVTEKVRGEALLRLEHNITRFMTEADSTSSAINDVIQAICTSEGWECGDWWSVDEQASLRRLD
jgi:PAS domain-containing protein